MTQIAQFALVVVCVAVASLWALVRKGNVKWFLLIVGDFVAWLVLPSVILQTEWGYYQERGEGMASSLGNVFDASTEYWIKRATDLAREDCGDVEGFDVNDPSLQWTAMPEQAVVQHFFRLAKYSNVVWLGVGWKDRYCLGRYHVTDVRDLGLYPWPTQLFPYPFFPWISLPTRVESRFLGRLPPPSNPPKGVRALFPGQCVTGEIAKGETARFQVEVPYFGQKIKLDIDLECIYEKDHSEFVKWTKSGRPIVGSIDKGDDGGTYQIALRAPTTESKRFAVGVFWGIQRLGCPLPKGWWSTCRRVPDPDLSNDDSK